MSSVFFKSPISNEVFKSNNIKLNSSVISLKLNNTFNEFSLTYNLGSNASISIYRIHSNKIGTSISTTNAISTSEPIYAGDSLLFKLSYTDNYIQDTVSISGDYLDYKPVWDSTNSNVLNSFIITNIQSDISIDITTKEQLLYEPALPEAYAIPTAVGSYAIDTIYLWGIDYPKLYCEFTYGYQSNYRFAASNISASWDESFTSPTYSTRFYVSKSGSFLGYTYRYYDVTFQLRIVPKLLNVEATIYLDILTSTTGTTTDTTNVTLQAGANVTLTYLKLYS